MTKPLEVSNARVALLHAERERLADLLERTMNGEALADRPEFWAEVRGALDDIEQTSRMFTKLARADQRVPTVVEHTPEPWQWLETGEACEFVLVTSDVGRWVISFRQNGELMLERQRANAQRIIDCVNACAGLNPSAIPAVVAALEAASCRDCLPSESDEIVCDECRERRATLRAVRAP